MGTCQKQGLHRFALAGGASGKDKPWRGLRPAERRAARQLGYDEARPPFMRTPQMRMRAKMRGGRPAPAPVACAL